MEKLFFIAFIILLLLVIGRALKRSRIKQREGLIDTYNFPTRLQTKVQDTYPHLTQEQVQQVIDGLRDYFHICNIAGKRMVSMPSQAVDVAWHEFILFTRDYKTFCEKALGRFIHHTPAEAMDSPTRAQKGIKTAWKIACFREAIDAKAPHRLPRLFALDALLKIPDGFTYSLNCKSPGSNDYCAGHIGCGSGCGGGCGGGGGDSDGCGGGCGGGD